MNNEIRTQLKNADSGKTFINNLLNNVANETSGPDARRGCLLMNTASEFAQTDQEIAELVSSSIDSITNIFELAIQQAQRQEEISSDKNARTLATYLVSNMSGLKNMVKAGADRETIKRIASIVMTALD